MSTNDIQKGIKNLFQAMVDSEESKVNELYKSNSERYERSCIKMKPVVLAFRSLLDEVSDYPEVEIYAPKGSPTVKITVKTNSTTNRYELSDSSKNEGFDVYYEWERYYSGFEEGVRIINFDTVEELIEYGMQIIAKEVGRRKAITSQSKR